MIYRWAEAERATSELAEALAIPRSRVATGHCRPPPWQRGGSARWRASSPLTAATLTNKYAPTDYIRSRGQPVGSAGRPPEGSMQPAAAAAAAGADATAGQPAAAGTPCWPLGPEEMMQPLSNLPGCHLFGPAGGAGTGRLFTVRRYTEVQKFSRGGTTMSMQVIRAVAIGGSLQLLHRLYVLPWRGDNVAAGAAFFDLPPPFRWPPSHALPSLDMPPPSLDMPPPSLDMPPPSLGRPPPSLDLPPPSLDLPPLFLGRPPPFLCCFTAVPCRQYSQPPPPPSNGSPPAAARSPPPKHRPPRQHSGPDHLGLATPA